MSLLGPVAETLAAWITNVIATLGYGGVFFLMALESMVFPVPSESVMPFAGYLAWKGEMDTLAVFVASTLGSLAGSLASYEMGRRWGEAFVARWGRWFLLSRHDLELAHRFFERRGALAVLVCRFIPGVRHVISIPAGSARMALAPFLLVTAIGAAAWNMILFAAGWYLGANWQDLAGLLHYLDYVAVAGGLGFVAWWVIRHRRRAAERELG